LSTQEHPVTVLELMGQASASTPGPEHPPPPRGGEDLMERVERLSAELEAVRDPAARGVAEQLMAAVLELHGEGLERILALVDEDTARALADDGVVASLMLIHDLYPVPLEERVMEALDSVRPYMESHGGNVELLGIEDGVARLRLDGSCNGCAASASTLELAIEKALMDSAPDLLGLDVEGVEKPPPAPEIGGTPLPLANGSPTSVPALAGWQDLDDVAGLREGETTARTVGRLDVLVANVNGTLLAYRDACAACEAPLHGGVLGGSVLGCPACSARFDLPRAGRGVDDTSLQLDPVPLLRDGAERVRVALPS
jgi:Fe-S cluster biogenesis protein NfuA/nitrite reductase/ring-hydroxylating ferredoxin subunit